METRANYVLIGAFTLLVAALALAFGLWAARYAGEGDFREFRIRFVEAVTGLSEGSSVLYNGVNVGRVTRLRLNPDDPREVLARIRVDSTVPVREDTVASIRLTGLTGLAAIQLSGGHPDSPPLGRPAHGGLPEITAQASPLHRLMESSEGIMATANKLLLQADQLLSDQQIERISTTIEGLSRLSQALGDRAPEIGAALDQLVEATGALPGLVRRAEGTLDRIDRAVSGLDTELIAELPAMRSDLAETLERVAGISRRVEAIVAANEDALTRLGDVGLEQVGSGLEDLRGLVRDLSNLVRSLERNPSRFLIGGERPEEYVPE